MTLDERLAAMLAPLGATAKRMFGGTCYMIDGHMVAGTLKKGIIIRVGKDGHDAAMQRPGARIFDMTGRPMRGFISVADSHLKTEADLRGWIDLALACVKALPPRPVGKPARSPARRRA